MFPIKYIENNLVWNQRGEVFAYYEFLPYHYSCLSEREKWRIAQDFRALLVGQKDGDVHLLQVATDRSIAAVGEESKRCIQGTLHDFASKRMEELSAALVDELGAFEVDYRFYIGFRLMKKDAMTVSGLKKQFIRYVSDFVRDVNHRCMGDFVRMDLDEVRRFQSMERFLFGKISRRFAIRPLEAKDFFYLLSHLYGQEAQDFADFQYDYPIQEVDGAHVIKRYDVLRPARCVMKEKLKSVQLLGAFSPVYVSYFVVEHVVGELAFPGSELFYYQQKALSFPVDTSVRVEVVENRKALSTVRNKKKELKDLDEHAVNNGSEADSIVQAREAAEELEGELEQTREPMYRLSYVIRVSASSEEELSRRCDEVLDFYDDSQIKILLPSGSQLYLHEECLPGAYRQEDDYIQYVSADFLSVLGFGATQQIGEACGMYLGFSMDTGRNVYIQPALAAQGVKGSATNALAISFLGSLGGGKSFLNNLIVYYSVLFGAKAIVLDPKSERGEWAKYLPELSPYMQVINLTSEEANRGMLDPFVIMKNRKDAEALAVAVCSYLMGISLQDREFFPTLRRAVKVVSQGKMPGMLQVIDELYVLGTEVSVKLADHLASFADLDFAQLLFGDGSACSHLSLEQSLNIIQIADLSLPENGKKPIYYTTNEQLSVAMLLVISTFSLDFIHSDRSVYKIVDLDEAWTFLSVPQGKELANKLIRAGRSMNASVFFVTQNASDVSDSDIKNNIGLKFAFRLKDLDEIRDTLAFYGLDPDDESMQQRMQALENGQCLFQDLYGRVGFIQVHPVFESLFQAFDTRPPVRR